ncbi:hypothetical protein [Streptomyces sp. 8L]|uniref:hypothetical protein n=1 Tax=Streptomyces sp. 8L TaxID=2877242 RepID=UPI001CD34589|nr:hypothetical protein [Streptomyces sp. 8L]MCA1218401.1 hypothetical protein [Streptomyces sp. 8L]
MTDADARPRGAGAFDFLIGTWSVANRRLSRPLSGSTEWDEFPATAVCRGTLFEGGANLDEIVFPTKGFAGLTLRLYDPERDEWSLNWVSSSTGRLSPPIVGRFGTDGTGEFNGKEIHEGATVACRFIWSRITEDTARWEQAFATADGDWETNWYMDFSRTA